MHTSATCLRSTNGRRKRRPSFRALGVDGEGNMVSRSVMASAVTLVMVAGCGEALAVKFPGCAFRSVDSVLKVVFSEQDASERAKRCLLAHLRTVTDRPIEMMSTPTSSTAKELVETAAADVTPVRFEVLGGLARLYAVITHRNPTNEDHGSHTGANSTTAASALSPLEQGAGWKEL